MKQAEHCGRGSPDSSFLTVPVLPSGNPRNTSRSPRGFLHADVKPHRRVEASLLRQHQVGQVIAEVGGVLDGFEVALEHAPVRDGVDHAADELAHAGLALGRAHLAVEIFADDDVGGSLGPVRRHLHVALFEDDSAFIVADGRCSQLPGHFVVGSFSGLQLGR